MANFLEDLDNKQVKFLELNHIDNKDYYFYLDILFPSHRHIDNIKCIKRSKTKFIIIDKIDGIKLYLSDLDIINTIARLDSKVLVKILDKMKSSYNTGLMDFEFCMDNMTYKLCGIDISQFTETELKTTINTKADFKITLEELLLIINLILSKERASELLYKEHERVNNIMRKYISLIALRGKLYTSEVKIYLKNIIRKNEELNINNMIKLKDEEFIEKEFDKITNA